MKLRRRPWITALNECRSPQWKVTVGGRTLLVASSAARQRRVDVHQVDDLPGVRGDRGAVVGGVEGQVDLEPAGVGAGVPQGRDALAGHRVGHPVVAATDRHGLGVVEAGHLLGAALDLQERLLELGHQNAPVRCGVRAARAPRRPGARSARRRRRRGCRTRRPAAPGRAARRSCRTRPSRPPSAGTGPGSSGPGGCPSREAAGVPRAARTWTWELLRCRGCGVRPGVR